MAKLDELDQKARTRLMEQRALALADILSLEDEFEQLLAYADEQWRLAMEGEIDIEPESDRPGGGIFSGGGTGIFWVEVIARPDYTPIMRVAHSLVRLDTVDRDLLQAELLNIRRRAYEQELSIQAGRVGCAGRLGKLNPGPSLDYLTELSRRDADSIINTFNRDLAIAIQALLLENPNLPKGELSRRLGEWRTNRDKWKLPQIMMFTDGTARSLAQADFVSNNRIEGVAMLYPRTAKEEICQGWINRGEVPLGEAMQNPSPYHQGCPHYWLIRPNKIPRAECPNLWMG